MDDAFLNPPKIIIANWKMYGTSDTVSHWLDNIAPTQYTVGLCVQAPLLPFALQHKNPFVKIGAQDCHSMDEGAFTGCTSPKLLASLGVHYVIVGHSERRHMESDHDIHEKAIAALRHHMMPILCVGESLDVREKGEHIDFVMNQLDIMCRDLSHSYMIAYEPRFAIGTGRIPSTTDIHDMHNAIRKKMCTLSSRGQDIPILYGGSVKPENAHALLQIQNVDGLLVGGASLKIDEFNGILIA